MNKTQLFLDHVGMYWELANGASPVKEVLQRNPEYAGRLATEYSAYRFNELLTQEATRRIELERNVVRHFRGEEADLDLVRAAEIVLEDRARAAGFIERENQFERTASLNKGHCFGL